VRLAAVVLFLVGAAATAHELGTIRTNVVFTKQGDYVAVVLIDREHVPPGFPGAPVNPTSRRTPEGADADPRAEEIVQAIADASRPMFDGREVLPDRVEWWARGPAAAAAGGRPGDLVLRLSGRIPGDARTFAWSSRARLGSYLLTVRTEGDASPTRVWLEGGETSAAIPLNAAVVPPSRGKVERQYLALGYTHILPRGTDHILFVLGIFLLSRRLRPILVQVTAFTIAHTITLALTIYGVVSLRPAIVEPLIALSIVYVAVENLFTNELNPWRVALVFAFGLVHGMGFAGVLSELGLPRREFLPALLSFNAGVELGQLTVILAAFLALGLPFRHRPWYRRRIVIPGSLAIAAVGLFWAVQRIAAAMRT
ncbi:MAG: HupE/UreJ family protein, partial [Acidobacteriota bacterium]